MFGANLAYERQTVNAEGVLVSGSYFPLLGVRPALGRLLGPEDDRTIAGHFVAVLSHNYWANKLGADRGVLNKTIVINGQPMTIVGVTARGFDGFDNRRSYWAYLFGRLKPGVSIAQASTEINTRWPGSRPRSSRIGTWRGSGPSWRPASTKPRPATTWGLCRRASTARWSRPKARRPRCRCPRPGTTRTGTGSGSTASGTPSCRWRSSGSRSAAGSCWTIPRGWGWRTSSPTS